MDPELLRLLLALLRDQNTTGSAATGGDVPYDDYDVFSSIGGLGAVQPGDGGNFDDGSIESLNGRPATYDTSPSTVGFYGPQAQVEQQQRLAELLARMQQGADAGGGQSIHGLFGNGPRIERPRPRPQVTPVAAPVAGTARPAPRGTTTPDPRRDVSALPNKPKEKRVPMRAPQAAQHIAAQGRAALPQRQYSAPAPAPQRMYSAPPPVARNHFLGPAFTPASPPPRGGATPLANTLNVLRSLSRR